MCLGEQFIEFYLLYKNKVLIGLAVAQNNLLKTYPYKIIIYRQSIMKFVYGLLMPKTLPHLQNSM